MDEDKLLIALQYSKMDNEDILPEGPAVVKEGNARKPIKRTLEEISDQLTPDADRDVFEALKDYSEETFSKAKRARLDTSGNLHEMTEVFDGIETKTSLLGIALDVEASSSSLLERSEYLSTPGRKKAIEAAEAAKQQTFKAASCLYKSIDKAKNMFWGENGEKVIPASYSGMNFEGLSVQLVTKKCRDQIARNEFLELMQMANESEIGITEKCDILEILYSFGMIYLQIYPEKTIAFLQYCTYLAKMSYYINVKGLLEFDTIVRKSFIQNSDRNWQISDIKSLTNPVYYERYHYDGRYPEFCRNWNYGDCVSEWCYREHACRICGKNDDHKALDCIFRA